MNTQFAIDVHNGLSKDKKTLPSKYFYDKVGDELFVKIMHSPEYYLTRSELEIFQEKAAEIIQSLAIDRNRPLEVIELGAGDGLKTKYLLQELIACEYDFSYVPVDISRNALDHLCNSLTNEFPGLDIIPKNSDYFEALQSLKETDTAKIILFLGSNLGNMMDDMAAEYIYKLGSNLRLNDKILLGLDLIKSEEIVLPAYNDKQGFTRDFNLNLLKRINTELGGNFDTDSFYHSPTYSESTGIAKSYLVSRKKQTIRLSEIDQEYQFEKDERIHTEISRKYNDSLLNTILSKTDFTILEKFMDRKGYFANYVLNRE